MQSYSSCSRAPLGRKRPPRPASNAAAPIRPVALSSSRRVSSGERREPSSKSVISSPSCHLEIAGLALQANAAGRSRVVLTVDTIAGFYNSSRRIVKRRPFRQHVLESRADPGSGDLGHAARPRSEGDIGKAEVVACLIRVLRPHRSQAFTTRCRGYVRWRSSGRSIRNCRASIRVGSYVDRVTLRSGRRPSPSGRARRSSTRTSSPARTAATGTRSPRARDVRR